MTDVGIMHREEIRGDNRVFLGFWVYLMSDCLLFASLFATFAVLRNNTFGGPPGSELFSLSFVLVETLILLTSSFTAGMALLYMRRNAVTRAYVWSTLTFALGAAFLTLELMEFAQLAAEGNSWQRSGFLSAFFTLVGTHGLHVAAGLVWLLTLVAQMWQRGITTNGLRRFACFAMFWHFLDVVWIFIFTIVYLMSFI